MNRSTKKQKPTRAPETHRNRMFEEIEAEIDRIIEKERTAKVSDRGESVESRPAGHRRPVSEKTHAKDIKRMDPLPTPSGRMNKLIVAIGDLHGHYRALERILDALQGRGDVFGEGGQAQLLPGVQFVFTGDYIDRGRHALRIIDRLRSLAEQNPGQVVTLLGNHELMALEGYDEAVRLLTRSAAGSGKGMAAAYGRLTDHGRNGGVEFVREFGNTSLPAFESYVARMARPGDIGHWMRMLLPAYRTRIAGRDVLFTHADLPAEYRDQDVLDNHLRWIDEHLKASTLGLGGSRAKWAHRRLAGMFWGRSFTELASASQAQIAALCRKVGVEFIVTGHTPHGDITVYGKRIFDIDVGMTPSYGENMPQALVFSRKGIVGLRADGTTRELVRFGASTT